MPSAPKGVGKAGRPMHPQPRVRNKTKHTSVVTTGPPETPGIPARNGFNGLFRALPGDRACLPPSPADIASADLTPASGRQDHTTSPSAISVVRLRPHRVHRIPPRVRDDREPPLLSGRDGVRCAADLGVRSRIMAAAHWHDGQITSAFVMANIQIVNPSDGCDGYPESINGHAFARPVGSQ